MTPRSASSDGKKFSEMSHGEQIDCLYNLAMTFKKQAEESQSLLEVTMEELRSLKVPRESVRHSLLSFFGL
jgi:hypothetical protein